MATSSNLILLCGIFALGFCSVTGVKQISRTDDFKQLSLWEKISLFTLSRINVKQFDNVPLEELFIADDEPWVDAIFVDLRSFFVQGWNIPEDQDLFEMDWHSEFEFCFFGCFYLRMSQTTKETRFLGQNDMIHETEITPTTVTNRYYVPLFQWSSPNYLFNVTTGYDGEASSLLHGLVFTLAGANTTFSFDYYYVPELGFQVDKLKLDFTVDRMESLFLNLTYVDNMNGDWEEYGSTLIDYAEYVRSDWVNYYKDDYMPHLKDSINCVLSGGRVDPIGCEESSSDYYNSVLYYKLNIVQLFETFGLAAVNRPEA